MYRHRLGGSTRPRSASVGVMSRRSALESVGPYSTTRYDFPLLGRRAVHADGAALPDRLPRASGTWLSDFTTRASPARCRFDGERWIRYHDYHGEWFRRALPGFELPRQFDQLRSKAYIMAALDALEQRRPPPRRAAVSSARCAPTPDRCSTRASRPRACAAARPARDRRARPRRSARPSGAKRWSTSRLEPGASSRGAGERRPRRRPTRRGRPVASIRRGLAQRAPRGDVLQPPLGHGRPDRGRDAVAGGRDLPRPSRTPGRLRPGRGGRGRQRARPGARQPGHG